MRRSARRRWSDNEHRFGPFIFSLDRPARLGVTLDTGDCEYAWTSLRAHIHRCTLIVALPSFLAAGREYGAVCIEGAMHLRYGPQTMDSSTEKSKCWFIPWTNWRHVRHSIYGLHGEHHATQGSMPWGEWYEVEKACPSASFEFDDFDGERIVAKTHIEEREWRLGTGWFRWLSFLCRARIRRSLDIDFSKETGKKKGSWKGGTTGHGIDMHSGELHESAFRRYCDEHQMAFVSPLPARGGA